MQQLHPKAVWLFFFGSLLRVLWLIVILAFVLIYFGIQGLAVRWYAYGIMPNLDFLASPWFYLTFLPLWFVIAYIWAKLSYHFYRFELGKDVLKIERGVIWKRYVSIPYDRIQNVDIYRGILDRIFGLSDVQVQTAGLSFPHSRLLSEGRLPGLSVQDAEKIREDLIKKVKGTNQGV